MRVAKTQKHPVVTRDAANDKIYLYLDTKRTGNGWAHILQNDKGDAHRRQNHPSSVSVLSRKGLFFR